MKKFLVILLAFVMVVGMFAGCETSPTNVTPTPDASTPVKASKPPAERKQITFWFWGAATEYQEHMKNVLATWYNNSQDQYELVIEFRNTVDSDIPVALAAKSGPDIVYASGPSYTSVYAMEGLVLDLNDYSKQYGWQDRILKVIYDACTVDNKLFSVPGAVLIGGLYYNKELFQEKEWETPNTMADLEAIFEKAKAEGIYPLGAGNKGWKPCNDHFSSMIINHTISPSGFYDALTGKVRFNNSEMIKGVEKSAEWYSKGYLSGSDYVNLDSQEVMQLLADKRAAMVMAPTLYTQFAKQSFIGAEADKVGFVAMPSYYTDKAIYDVSIPCNFSINANTKYADECAKILDHMMTAEFAVEMTKEWPGYWTIPVKDLVEYDASDLTGLAKMSIEAIQTAIPSIDAGNFAFHPSTFFPPATLTAYQDVDSVWQGVMTAEDFCESVAKELDLEIEEGLVCPLAKPAQ